MLRDHELESLARAVAALDDEDVGRLKKAVQTRKAEAHLAELRAMSDEDVMLLMFSRHHDNWPNPNALRLLRDAGFVREQPKQRISFVFPGGHSIEIFGSMEDLGCVKDHLCDAVPGTKYSKGG